MSKVCTVHVVDDDSGVRESLQWLFSSAGYDVATYIDAQAFLESVAGNELELAGCLVVDLRLPGMSGLQLGSELQKRGVRLPAIMISGHSDVSIAVRAMKSGAFDFMEKPFDEQALLVAVSEAINHNAELRREDAARMMFEQRFSQLTERERQVMEGVVQGKLNKQVAAELGLSPKTVEVHRAHVMAKMQATSLAELVRISAMLRPEPWPLEERTAELPPEVIGKIVIMPGVRDVMRQGEQVRREQ